MATASTYAISEPLWLKYKGLAKAIAAKRLRLVNHGHDGCFEDLFQSGWLSLWESSCTYDPNQGVKFSTYAYRGVLGAVRCESWRQSFWGFNAAKAKRLKDYVLPSRHAVPWSSPETEELEPYELPCDHAAARELAYALLARVPSHTEREVARLYYLEGKTTMEVAHSLGLSRDRVEQARPKAIARMRKEAQEMGLFD